MKIMDILLNEYFYRLNKEVEVITDKESPRYKEMHTMLNDIYNMILIESKQEGLEVINSIGYINYDGRIVEKPVKYTAIGKETNEIEYILEPIYECFNILNMERPSLEFFLYYHPFVSIRMGSQKIRGLVLDETLIKKTALEVKLKIRINICYINEDCLKYLLKIMTKQILWEKAFSYPSENLIETYSKELFQSVGKKEISKIIIGIKDYGEMVKDKINVIENSIMQKKKVYY